MSNTTLGLTPGAAGIQQYSGSPVSDYSGGGVPISNAPAVVPIGGAQGGGLPGVQYGGPFSQSQMTAAQQLQNQTQVDDVANTTVQAQLLATQTAAAIRQQIDATEHTIAQEAISSASEQTSDEIQQAKKAVDNSSKAV